MPSWDNLFAFFAATLVYGYIQGPAMIYASAQTLARGRRAGFMAALGIQLGGFVHVGAAARQDIGSSLPVARCWWAWARA